jgi:iron(II)-dependent oxidoreductase
VYAILEHEAMHQETLRYLCHRLPTSQKRRPTGYRPVTRGVPPPQDWIGIPRGRAVLGVAPDAASFTWDNERPAHEVEVPAFAIERHDTTNAAYREFIEAGGYREARWWRSEDWAWIQRERIGNPAFWQRESGEW